MEEIICFFRGDDDINDVAAMGGVNLAEETQRILGSTEFVGTQIRSCKDDIYLHTTPLMQKISQIGNVSLHRHIHQVREPTSFVNHPSLYCSRICFHFSVFKIVIMVA